MDLALPHPSSTVADCVTVSLGISARTPGPGTKPQDLVEEADSFLYQAKKAGRNQWKSDTSVKDDCAKPGNKLS